MRPIAATGSAEARRREEFGGVPAVDEEVEAFTDIVRRRYEELLDLLDTDRRVDECEELVQVHIVEVVLP